MTPSTNETSSDGSPVEWWFNTKTEEVEFGRQTAAPYRIGPFRTEAEAKNALARLAERASEWRESEED